MSDRVLVIGGGIAGIQASLDLAAAGARVVLVERSASLGGKMAALDKNFPTLDCSICIEAPMMSEINDNANIEVLSNAEVDSLAGEAGSFVATIRHRAGYVTDECTRCDDCIPVCPVKLPNEFDAAIGSRKAIYTPFQQAVPDQAPGQFIILMAGQFGLDELPESTGTREANDLVWTLYSFEAAAQHVDMALAEGAGPTTYMVVVTSTTGTRDRYFDDVFLTGVDAFKPLP